MKGTTMFVVWLKARLHRRFLSQQLNATFAGPKCFKLQIYTDKLHLNRNEIAAVVATSARQKLH